MGKSWELSDEQKKDIEERSREIGAEYDPETGKKKNQAESTGDNEDVEGMDSADMNRERNNEVDDDNVR